MVGTSRVTYSIDKVEVVKVTSWPAAVSVGVLMLSSSGIRQGMKLLCVIVG